MMKERLFHHASLGYFHGHLLPQNIGKAIPNWNLVMKYLNDGLRQ